VDDMYASMSAKLGDALKTISNKPVKIILNTHFHGDHIQGNKNFQQSAVIIGHQNISKRLIKQQGI
jgi:cyclase